MVRALVAALAIFSFMTMSAHADVITVDGSISDWPSGLIKTDPSGDGAGGFDILRYGATVNAGTFYAFVELSRPISDYDGGLVFPGAWINADRSNSTELLKVASGLEGTDIDLEWGRGAGEGSGSDPDFNYWGKNDDVATVIDGGVPGGAHADSGNGLAHGIIEWSAPVSGIRTTLAGLPDNVSSNFDWSVTLAGEGSAGGWGRDFAGPITVPEPATLLLLAAGGLGLLACACRRRKRGA